MIRCSLRSSLFRFLAGKRDSREGTGTGNKKISGRGEGHPLPPVLLFALAPCVRATSPWLSLPLRGNGKDCYAGMLNGGGGKESFLGCLKLNGLVQD